MMNIKYLCINNVSSIHITPDGGWLNLTIKEESLKNADERKLNIPEIRKISYFPCIPINKSAQDFLLLCDGSKTYDQIIAILAQKYQVDKNEALKSINQFFEVCLEQNHLKLLEMPTCETIKITGSTDVYYPVHMQFELTDKCNMYCNYCYRNAEYLKGTEVTQFTDIPFEKLKTMLDDCYENGVKTMEITGGEPMMSTNFVDVIRLLGSYGILVAIETNGSFITEEIADIISECGNIMLSVSLDAHNEEINKKISHCPGAFEKTVKGLKLLAERKIMFRVTTVACQENIDHIEDILLLAKNIGATQYGCALPMSFGRQKDAEGKNTDVWIKTAQKFTEIYPELDKKYPHFISKIDPVSREYHREVGNCGIGHRSFSVDPSGNVRACPLNLAEWSIVGNLYSETYASIFASPKIEFFRKLSAPSEEYCCECDMYLYCNSCVMRGTDKYLEKKKSGVHDCSWGNHFKLDSIITPQ